MAETEKKIMPGCEPIFQKGNKTGVLLLHGFTGSPFEMKPLADSLIQDGYTVSVPLLCGHGTNHDDLLKCKWYDWFNNVKEALFEMRKNCKKVIVCGLSTGGSLALHLAAHYQIEGIVALAPGLVLKEKKSILLPFVAPFKKYRSNNSGPDISDSEMKKKIPVYTKTPLKAALEIVRLYEHLRMDLPEIYSPLMLAHSRNDHVVDFKSSELIYENVSSKNKRFLKLEKSYHIITLDIEQKILFREIKKFINEV